MPQCSFNDYLNFTNIENSLLLANDRVKSLECLLASKDFIIYHMSMCNAYMARPPILSIWKPPLPNYPPSKEGTNAADNFSQSPTRADCCHSNPFKTPMPAQVNLAASSKSANVESQMRQGGGGVSTYNRPQQPSFTSSLSVKGHSVISESDRAASKSKAAIFAAGSKTTANFNAANLKADAEIKYAADFKLACDLKSAADLKSFVDIYIFTIKNERPKTFPQ